MIIKIPRQVVPSYSDIFHFIQNYSILFRFFPFYSELFYFIPNCLADNRNFRNETIVQRSHVMIYHKNEGYFNRFHNVECDRSVIIDVNTWHKISSKRISAVLHCGAKWPIFVQWAYSGGKNQRDKVDL